MKGEKDMNEMTSMERMAHVLMGLVPDRVPVVFGALTVGAVEAGVDVREYATSGKAMARGKINFAEKYGVDSIPVMSDIAAYSDAFGCKSKFFDGELQTPVISEHVVKDWRDWGKIEPIDPTKDGRIPPMLEACKIIKEQVGDKIPIAGVTPSPITWSTWLQDMAGVLKDTKRHPEELKKALAVIAESALETGKAFVAAGVNSIIMNVTRSTLDILTVKQYEEFRKPYDLYVLDALSKLVPCGLHVCGVNPMLDMLTQYPVMSINWWDRGNADGISLTEFRKRYGTKIVMAGGLDQTKELLNGTPEEVEAQARDAFAQVAKVGGGFILSGGCELSAITPPENIHAAISAAKKYGRYPL